MTIIVSGALSLAVVAVLLVERARAAHQISQINTNHTQEVQTVADQQFHRGLRQGLLSSTKQKAIYTK
jgi:hypothetical protein